MDIEQVVLKLEEFGYIRTNKIIGDYYSIYCPFHNNGNEKKASFGILLHDQYKNSGGYKAGFCHCFTCGYAKDIVSFVSDIFDTNSITKSALDWFTENIIGFESYEFDYLLPQQTLEALNNKYAIDYLKANQNNSEVTYISEEELKNYRFTVPYMYERKLTDEVIAKFDIGFDKDWIPNGRKSPIPCITFPVRDKHGRTLFLCRRAIDKKMYHYPQGVTKPLYGIDQLSKDTKILFICESCINALTLWSWGYPAVALMGTGNSYQIRQLKELGIKKLILCMDGDDAGRNAMNKLKKQLSSTAFVYRVDMPEGKDVNDLSREEFEELYQERY